MAGIEVILAEPNGLELTTPHADDQVESSPKGGNNGAGRETEGSDERPSPCQSELRRKQRHSAYIFVSFVALGMVVALHGPTFLDLLLIIGVDLESGTVLFTSGSIGYLLGSLIGGIVYDRFNKEMLLLVSTTLMGVFTVAVPFTPNLPTMAVVSCIRGCMMGGLDTGGNALMVKIWGKDVGPYMQALHFAFGLGGIIAPFVAEPFLLSKPEVMSNRTLGSHIHVSAADTMELTTQIPSAREVENHLLNNSGNIFRFQNSSGNHTGLKVGILETNVYIPYLIIGFVAVLSALPYIEMFLSQRAEKRRRAEHAESDSKEVRHIPLSTGLKITFFILMGTFYISYACVEDAFAGFLMTFVVKHLKWSKTKGTQITSVFWIAFSAGRLFAILVSKFLTPWKMLATDLALLVVSFLALILGVESSEIFCWVCTVVIAIAMASIFPTGMTWMDKRILKITGKVASFLLVCASVGNMGNPLLVGYLFETYTPMWFPYLLFTQTLMCSLNFAITSILVIWVHKKWKNRKSRIDNDDHPKPQDGGLVAQG